MTGQGTRGATNELVPLVERLRYMRFFRYALILIVIVLGLGIREARVIPTGALAGGIAIYLMVALASEVVVHRFPRRSLTVFGAMLMVDGLFLAFAMYGTGGALSPVRYLILLHLVAVALLASYRTGLKMAMWHSLLLYVFFYAQEGRILSPIPASLSVLTSSQCADSGRSGASSTRDSTSRAASGAPACFSPVAT